MALFFYKEKNKDIRAAAYLRLSIEDGDKAESNSIGNQRELIRDFAAERPGLHLVEEYADDGYTGTNFERPGFKRMIDAVDFAADEVRLTNIEDKNRPIRFSESIQYVRSYVEDAGTAVYDTIPKKPATRESIRDKLKSAQKAQPTHTPKPQKNKGKDMEL